ncbi:MAG: ATP-binding protein [Bacteroidota bacterium]
MAEEFLKKMSSETTSIPFEGEILKLFHELKVYQIELKMQNEEFLLAKNNAEVVMQKYTELYNNAPSGYFTFSSEGEIIDLNLRGAQILGKEHRSLKGSRFGFFVSDDTKPIFNLFLCKIFAGKTRESCEVALSIESSNLPLYVYMKGHISENGEQCHVTMVDITDRKHADEALRENERFLKETQAIARLGSYKLDFTFNRWSGSDILYDIFGIDTDYDRSLNGWASIFHPDWRKVMTDFFIQGLRSNRTKVNREFKIIRKIDKEERWVHGIGNFTFNDNNQPMTMIGTMQDITERKEAAEELKKKVDELTTINKELEKFAHANAELEQFAFIASHNLQQPLRTISNFVQIFKEDYSGVFDDKAHQYLHVVDDATRRMTVLLNSLLDFSRLGRNLNLTNVDCKKIIDDVITDLGELIITSNAGIEVADMPELNVYESEFRQLFQNLIVNAIKFRGKDTQPKIQINSEYLNEKWKFTVSDNGIGIAAKNFEKIFDIFQRLHTDAEYQGSGIGLAFCKKIVHLHKGEIWLESTIGQGTTFYFTIPNLTE